MGPEEKKFLKWFRAEQKKGLVDFHVTLARGAGKSDRELALCEQTIRRVFNGKGDLNYGRQNVSTGEVDVIICGHTHHCARYEYQLDDREGLVYSLGSWIEGGSFLEVIGEQFVLHPALDA